MVYKYIIDPLLADLRRTIRNEIHQGSSCLDIACGTGDMVFRLKDYCQSVVGIDMNETNMRAAQKRVLNLGLDHLEFQIQDATDLKVFNDKQFDFSIISLAVHQFNPDLREKIIVEALRVSKTVIVADYSCPVPNTLAGRLVPFAEFLAGKEHYRNFKDYQSNGGMSGLLNEMKLDFTFKPKRKDSVFSLFLIS